jgi:CheY-like chemotaxis protein
MPARLLIVDDEAPVVELLRRYLERLGHSVDVAYTANEALRLVESSKKYDLVVADLQLPDLNGQEMVRRMQSGNQNLEALISSGYPLPAMSSDRRKFIQKPFLPQELAERIAEILGSSEDKST